MQKEVERKEKRSISQPQVQASVKEEPKPKIKNGLSLKNFGRLKEQVKQQHVEETAHAANAADVEIPIDEFLKVWDEFAIAAKEKGKNSLHMLMTTNRPTLVTKNEFQIKVATETLKETFNTDKMPLVDKLTQKFGTTLFEILVEIEEISEEGKPKFLATPKEKYDRMVEINPELKNLMDELGLDFDY